jgi:ethanolamine utilization protein EutQ (cupin superfamily)
MAVVLKKASEFATEPFDAGDGKLSLVDVIAQPEQAPVSAGVAEIWESAPIEFDYDNDCAVCYMLEGRVTLTEGDTRLDFEPGDVVFVPQREGLKVSWDTPSYGKFFYVTYPHWR